MTFKVAAIQMDIAYKNPERNRLHVEELVKQAMPSKPDVLVLPETWTTGYSENVFHKIHKYAEPENGPTMNAIREMAIKYSVWFVSGSFPERDGANIYNTVYLINRSGAIVGKYRKMHLYSAMDEHIAFANGEDMPVWSTEFGPVAMMTCYDIRFVELSRTYAMRGAKVIFVVSNFPNPKVHHWRTLLQARAIENQVYIVACNRVGAAENCTYFGHSLMIDPWGEILAEGAEDETILVGAVDLLHVTQVRKTIPMFWDRQPQSYPQDMLLHAKFVDTDYERR
jgi:omega-amidase